MVPNSIPISYNVVNRLHGRRVSERIYSKINQLKRRGRDLKHSDPIRSRRCYQAKGKLLSYAIANHLVRFAGLRFTATKAPLQWHIYPEQLTERILKQIISRLESDLRKLQDIRGRA
jgi:Tfp pilus assembly protein PilN